VTADHRVWSPLSAEGAATLFEPLRIAWWVAGGVAVDLFAGRVTRPHGDLDIAVLRRDLAALDALRATWDVQVAHAGGLTPWDGGPLADAVHQFWARRRGDAAWSYEILLEATDGDDWLFRRDPRVRRPVVSIGLRTEDGVPYLAPELCLLYKARRPYDEIDRNVADFETVLPLLSADRRRWLAGALRTVEPEHPWLRRLEA
jgi:hypothetical protein